MTGAPAKLAETVADMVVVAETIYATYRKVSGHPHLGRVLGVDAQYDMDADEVCVTVRVRGPEDVDAIATAWDLPAGAESGDVDYSRGGMTTTGAHHHRLVVACVRVATRTVTP